MNYTWIKLNRHQLGKYGEYFAKMEFTRAGFDVYTSEVDDKGIDFVIRKNESQYYDIQVKSLRNCHYIFSKGRVFESRNNLYIVLILFKEDEQPVLLLVPSSDWKELKKGYLARQNYHYLKSGVILNDEDIHELKDKYGFDKQVKEL